VKVEQPRDYYFALMLADFAIFNLPAKARHIFFQMSQLLGTSVLYNNSFKFTALGV
jgi:hypothetical protein